MAASALLAAAATAALALITSPPAAAFTPSRLPNMNGHYQLSETQSSNTRIFPEYRDYPGGVGSFDVLSPLIVQRYSQVWWKALPPVDLPADVVQEFDGKTMAIVGFEIDQVIPGKGVNGTDLSVPINLVYNHHFESQMAGKAAKWVKVAVGPGETPQDHGGHGAPNNNETWVLRPADPAKPLVKGGTHSAGFGGANGGEYRKSFHGYPPGTGQLIDSPTSFVITPMQIDTWNRDKMPFVPGDPTRARPKFVPGPQPRSSLAPQSGPDALYSGLLECPLTTRVRKEIHANYVVRGSGTCGQLGIQTAPECFDAAKKLLPNATLADVVVDNATLPAGCAVQRTAGGRARVAFNTAAASTAACDAAPVTSVAGEAASLVKLGLLLDAKAGLAHITLTGPSAVWFGVGFAATGMGDEPWTVIVAGNTGDVSERKLVDQKPGTLLATTVKVVSNTVVDGVRTVLLTRGLKGAGPAYLDFDVTARAMNFINAVGSTPDFSYHKAKTPSSIMLLPTDSPVCICSGSPMKFGTGACKGDITYVATNQTVDIGAGTVYFNNECAPAPVGDLLWQKNPTCDLRTYVGGQLTCHHMWSLLDADQPIPWEDQPLEYHFKFRFWYQPYTTTNGVPSHLAITGGSAPNLGAGPHGTGAEFDVPKCGVGVPGCSKGPDGSWIHTVTGLQKMSGSGKLVAAHFHCHAPTCLMMEMFNNATGELLCRSIPTYGGNGVQRHQPNETRFQEAGFIAVPPCLWSASGKPEFGLDPAPEVGGLTVYAVKTSNATYGHHGEMAHSQFYYAH